MPQPCWPSACSCVSWHSAQHRPLAWRDAPPGQRDPYRVWASEIMLQQTRADTVVGYYHRWMERFPTISTLAAADGQEVLKTWEGLGYYARARNFHRAAQIVAAECDGQIPNSRGALLALPGIGEYTAGAILSLAFNRREPILDGNVKRVLARVFDIAEPVNQPPVLRELWSRARQFVEAAPDGAAGACNEALMELGAVVCLPLKPRCHECPLVAHCQAAARGVQADRPVMPPRKRTPHYDVAAGVIWQGARFQSSLLIAQRPHKGLLGGLWEFPGGKLEPQDADLAACLRREIKEELGIEIHVADRVATVQHAYTHFRITLHAFHAQFVSGEPQTLGCADWRWAALASLHTFPFPVTDLKIIAAIERQHNAQFTQ
ncbi:MAG: A/G-specific adenine glycosylase [Anaerolineales bacterium]|nr:A/G-specific adenine glycosylase [Anaerolineales bacterium]